MGEQETVVAKVVSSISEIRAAEWDLCANPDPATFNPFVSHAFLKALEDAGTVGEHRTGWIPHHITIEDGSGGMAACMPCYLKLHSQGEYVFDHAWANAYEQAGGTYYPKLQCAVPFTPVPGPRLLTAPGANAESSEKLLAAAAVEITKRSRASSLHISFVTEQQWSRLGSHDLLRRTGQQFHWRNDGYKTFNDFLASLSSRKRKAVRKEREEAASSGVKIVRLTGAEIKEEHWDAFFQFYMDTGSRKWGRPYLNRPFFSLLGAAMAGRCLLVMAMHGQAYIAGALHLIGGDCLYGRYWGTKEHHPFLHFEACYYQAIDYCIEHGLARAEAGAQGEHKLARGYLPVTTYSLHYLCDPGLHQAVARYLAEERRHVSASVDALSEGSPFRKTPGHGAG